MIHIANATDSIRGDAAKIDRFLFEQQQVHDFSANT